MRSLSNRRYDMLVCLVSFGMKYIGIFPPDGLPGQLFALIALLLTELAKQAGSQSAGFALIREGATAKNAARSALLSCLQPMVLAARSMGRVDEKIADKFVLPRATSDRDLIATARGFAEQAAAMKDEFIAHQLEPDFLDELEKAIASFESAIVGRQDAAGLRTNATESIEEVIEKAMDAAKRLDGMVPIKLKRNRPALKEWKSARRVIYPRTTAKTTAKPTTEVTAPPAVPEASPAAATTTTT